MENIVFAGPQYEMQRNHKCHPRISICLTYFQRQSWRLQPYRPWWKRANHWLWMLSGSTGGPEGKCQEACTALAQREPGDPPWSAPTVSRWPQTRSRPSAAMWFRKKDVYGFSCICCVCTAVIILEFLALHLQVFPGIVSTTRPCMRQPLVFCVLERLRLTEV